MAFADFYLERYSDHITHISQNPDPDLGFIVVIPSYKEEELLRTIRSLAACTPIRQSVEVIVVVNAPENASPEICSLHKHSIAEVESWIKSQPHLPFHLYLLNVSLPNRHAGVGLARKTGMDEAIRRFNFLDKPEGVIIGFDADATCDPDYLITIESHFSRYPGTNGCSLYFEHPLDGKGFAEENVHYITLYELYLRYYVEALKNCGFPYAFHTLGSSFAVSASAYIRQGGMNKRKAGEDFYFLHKIIPLGQYYDLTTTTIHPSPRPSDRVPFGTGAAIQKMISGKDFEYPSFHPESFLPLQELFRTIKTCFHAREDSIHEYLDKLSPAIKEYLYQEKAITALQNINANSSGPGTFHKRFFQWMDGLKVLQYLNYAHEVHYQRIPIHSAAQILAIQTGIAGEQLSLKQLLLSYREHQKKNAGHFDPASL